MKLTIAITFWDKDQENISNLLNQIEEKVSVEHEVIAIDNRNDTTTELSFTPTYSFGKNVHQFTARKKALELATGEFIWFVDGDDEILGLDEISDHDIQVYKYVSNRQEVLFDEEEITDFYNTETFLNSFVPLWNKIFRKSLFDGFDYEGDIISSEDIIYNLYAIKNAKSYKRFDKTIYSQNTGNSNKESVPDTDTIENIFYGYEDAMKIIKELCGDKIDYNAIEEGTFEYYMLFLNRVTTEEALNDLLTHLFDTFGVNRINKYFLEDSYSYGFHNEIIQPMFEYLETNYPDYEWVKYIEVTLTDFEGNVTTEKQPVLQY